MSNFYPNGAIKGKKQFEKLIDRRKGDLYLVNDRQEVYKIGFNPETRVKHLSFRNDWDIENLPGSVFHLRINPNSDYLESIITNGYVFSNFWHAWAYTNHLEQSGFAVDWTFPIGVG